MPVTDFAFKNQIFFAKESGVISGEDAQLWADKLAEYAQWSFTPIIALVDALEVTRIAFPAYMVFTKASFTPNVLEVVVATNDRAQLSSKNIGVMGRRDKTTVFKTMEEAQRHAVKLMQARKNG
jgi:hypothetical protein